MGNNPEEITFSVPPIIDIFKVGGQASTPGIHRTGKIFSNLREDFIDLK